MSDKKRRDITLGEMQDECKRHGDCGKCDVKTLCVHYLEKPYTSINLTDPPRFNEQQMAFWKALWCIGVRCVYRAARWYTLSSSVHDDCYGDMGTLMGDSLDWVEQGETLDLAELLGKDAI